MLRVKDINDQIEKMQKLIPFDPDEVYIETIGIDTSRIRVAFSKDGVLIAMECEE